MTPLISPIRSLRNGLWLLPLLVLGFSCSNDNLAQVYPRLELSAAQLEFGSVPAGESARQPLFLFNAGQGALLYTIQIDPNPDGVFSLAAPKERLEPGQQEELTIVFAPVGIQQYQGTLILTSNDPNQTSAEVILLGEGYQRGAIVVDPLALDFGTVNAGTSGLRQVWIQNVGNGDLKITNITLGQDTSADFSILSSTKTPAMIPMGAKIPLNIAYRPSAASVPSSPGSLEIQAVDPFQPKTLVSLTARLNQAPVANAGPDQQVDPARLVQLDGSLSTDPDGNLPLSFGWTMVRKPEGSTATIADANSASATFVPDLVGVYEIELQVQDSTGLQCLLPDRVLITALPAERLLLELVWDSPVADLDLHLLAPGGTLGGALDCFFGNRHPDWGETGNPADDPSLLRDDLMGFGPETIGYNQPFDGLYTVAVNYFSSHTPSGKEPTSATLRIFVDGFLKAEIARRIEDQGTQWNAASILWPEGTITETPKAP